MHYHQKLDESA